jgi:UDP:flavonoid glycosyltransferase YjiC (YdhE family)
MRILFTYMGGSGHFTPLAPIARAAEASGHDIAFLALPGTAAQVRAAGFHAIVAQYDSSYADERTALHERANALPTIAEREDLLLREGFAGLHARRHVPNVLRACAEWQPDLIVREEVDFGSAIVAERLGIPYATLLIIAAGSLVREPLVVEPLNALRAEHGLPPDPELKMLRRYPVLHPFPYRFRDPAFPLPPSSIPLRPLGLAPAAGETLPEWVARLSDAPLIYFSLGTEFNEERQELFAPVIAGVRELPVNLIVTVGRNLDPAAFGPQPPNVHIERFITQSLLMPRCAVVITHGGSGTIMGALSEGVPMVVIPLGADQPQNAARCAALGAGRVVIDTDVTPESMREAVEDVLTDPSYRTQAQRVRDEIAVLPGPELAVQVFERLRQT